MITDEGLYRKDVYAFEFHLRGLYKSHTNVVFMVQETGRKSLYAQLERWASRPFLVAIPWESMERLVSKPLWSSDGHRLVRHSVRK